MVSEKSFYIEGDNISSILTHERSDGDISLVLVANIGENEFVGRMGSTFESVATLMDPETEEEKEFDGTLTLQGGKAAIIVFEKQ